MKTLTSYIVFWKTCNMQTVDSDCLMFIKRDKWELQQTREEVCVLLNQLKVELAEDVFVNITVVTPQGMVFTAPEFIDNMCPCTASQPSCGQDEMFVLEIAF